MTALTAPLHLLALVLIVSGLQKVVAPGPATEAMRSARVPTLLPGSAAGVVLGVVEAAVGLVAISVPQRWSAAALGACFLGFAAFVVRLRTQDADAGCGCFGASSTPPGTAHVVLNVIGGIVGLTAAVVGVADIVEVFDDGIWVGVLYMLLLAIGSGLLLLGPPLAAELKQARAGGAPVPAFAVDRQPTIGRRR